MRTILIGVLDLLNVVNCFLKKVQKSREFAMNFCACGYAYEGNHTTIEPTCFGAAG